MINVNNHEELKKYCRAMCHNYTLRQKGKYVSGTDLQVLLHLANRGLTRLEADIKQTSKDFIQGTGDFSKDVLQSDLEVSIEYYEKCLEVFNRVDGGGK